MYKRLSSLALSALLLAAFALAVGTGHAHAYIDPGSGSLILQVVLAALVGSLVGLKVFWRRITDPLFRLFSRKKTATEPEHQADQNEHHRQIK